MEHTLQGLSVGIPRRGALNNRTWVLKSCDVAVISHSHKPVQNRDKVSIQLERVSALLLVLHCEP